MSNRFLRTVAALGVIASATIANAQNIDLTGGNADLIWHGTQPNANAGLWMDQGAVSGGDGRRDLIIGTPGGAGMLGRVYIINGGPNRSGDLSLASADAVITGAANGDLFGSQTAAGNILNTEGSVPRNLLVAAPNAMTGRGIVYLFATTPASQTAAAATFRVIGAPGDRLGTTLATADLNNDGRREIIMGAPGNDRIYIINGAAGLSGTRDLATQAADQVIGGSGSSGLGTVMAAGDVTGDNINDLLVGAPALSGVYLFKGNSAGTLTLDANFSGVVGDRAGESIRIGDLDSDGRRDVIIGAPGADGPGGRVDSGAIYVLWGSTTLTNRLLANADVTFYGEAAGHRLGENATSGDVNRDSPDDLVMLASGASGGAGQLFVYYGRSRSLFGVDGGSGRRIVDLAFGHTDRKILGDPATGVMRSVQVFEVTGEGARDIIVGVPSGESNAGLVYFTVSPRMRLSSGSFTLRVDDNGAQSGLLGVTNQSSIAVPFVTTSNRSWLSATPAGNAVNGIPVGINVNVSGAGLPVGVYTGTVNVTSTTEHLEMSLPVSVTLMVRKRVARFADFNADRIADMTLFRPSDGVWYHRYSNGATAGFRWGGGSDVPVPADYDGDGKIDLAVFRPSDGVWYLLYSSTNTPAGFQWGGGTDKPVPGDYDGDGRWDLAVFRPSDGVWYVKLATGATYGFQWGGGSDVPVPADYDGDGRTDIAVFRQGTWFIAYARGGGLATQWGAGNDLTVPGDYDGDGAVDLAVFRPSNGTWYIKYSSNGSAAGFRWGGNGDKPVANDYDGDGRTDLAVFRPSDGVWYLWYSSNNSTAGFRWGGGGDIPIR